MGRMLAICVTAILVLSPSLTFANYFGAYFEPADAQAVCFPQAAWVPFDVYFVLRECPFAVLGGFEFAWAWNQTPPGFSAIVAGIEPTPSSIPHRAAFNDFHDQGHIVPMEFNTWLGGVIQAVVLPSGWVDPGVAYVGDCIVPVEATRWGSVKALFR